MMLHVICRQYYVLTSHITLCKVCTAIQSCLLLVTARQFHLNSVKNEEIAHQKCYEIMCLPTCQSLVCRQVQQHNPVS